MEHKPLFKDHKCINSIIQEKIILQNTSLYFIIRKVGKFLNFKKCIIRSLKLINEVTFYNGGNT